jgi:hypothetical protein
MDVKEYNHEMTYTADDNSQRSYNPPRYEHTYDFFMVIKVNHPYFNEMRFRINDSSVVIRDQAVSADLFGNTFAASFDPSGNAEYSEYVRMGNEIINTLLKAHDSARAGASPAPGAPAHTPAAADPASAAVAAALAAVVCPYCGASTTPNERGCCKFCGGRLG